MILAGFIFYMALMLGIGVFAYFYRPIKSIDDFIVGNRSFGPVVTAFGTATTLASGYAFIGLVGMGYLMGTIALWQATIPPIIEFISWIMLSKKMRNYSEKHSVLTPVEMIAHLKGDPHNLLKIVGGLVVGVFMFAYLGGNFVAGGKAASVLGIPATPAIIGSALVVIAYTFLGGVQAVMLTDALQGFLMLVALIFIPLTAIIKVGGIGAMFTAIANVEPGLLMWDGGKAGYAWFVSTMVWVGVGWGFFGQPQGLQKYMIIQNPKDLPKAALMSCSFNAVRQYLPIIIGLSARVLFDNVASPEMIVPMMISEIFPNILGGMILAAIFAAIMSTCDSLLLQGCSEITRNLLQLTFMKGLTEKGYANATRIVTLILGLGALYTALTSSATVFALITFAFAGLCSSIAPPLYLALYWKKTTSWGMLVGMITGMTATILWYNGGQKILGLHEGFPSFVIAVAVTVVVSLLTQKANVKTGESVKA